MQLMLISAILLLSFWSTDANPLTPPNWIDDGNVENNLGNQGLSTINQTDMTTLPPNGCLTVNGFVPIGTAYNDGNCTNCTCIDPGKIECSTKKCPIECVDFAYIQGKCCPICLNGPNCQMPDGTILQKGKKRKVGPMICQCVNTKDSWEEPVADCNYQP